MLASSLSLTRRHFLGSSAAALGGVALVGGFPSILRGAPITKTLKIALVGCGGRGSGAANQALKADSNVELVAVADVIEDQARKSLENLKTQHAEKTKNTKVFVGLDSIDQLLKEDVDVVLLCAPPGFRPEHLEKCVKAGKHTFCEKPVATDVPGIHRFIAAANEAKSKGLGVQSGFCWRANYAERATFDQLHKGTAGKVMSYYGTYLAGSPWVKARKEGWTDLEYQLRNWLYFTWLSGDHLIEQAIHTVDKMSWAFQDVAPIQAVAMGGRQQRIEPEYGHVYDHFAVCYEYPDGARGFIFCRQQAGTYNENADHIIGTKGVCKINGFGKVHRISGETPWKYEGERPDMYQVEHDEFFASIRKGEAVNFGDKMAHSTLLGILGRTAAYTGKVITWEEINGSKEVLAPAAALDWNMKLDVPPVPMPGRTKLV